MIHPTIQDAKAICNKHRSLGALILSFAEGRYALASYGHRRDTCDAMRQVVEQIGDMIAAGDIEVPGVLGKATRGNVESGGAEEVNAELLATCEAVLRYDTSILGRAARGEVDLLDKGGGVASGDDLDALYFDMVDKARAAVSKAKAQ